MEKFIEYKKTGVLYIDKVLIETYYPILFICKNDIDDLFLCVCCQNNNEGIKWLLTKTSAEVILMILKDEITLRKAFLYYTNVQLTVYSINNDIKVLEDDSSDWNYERSIYLPDKDEYMEAEDGEFAEEIAYYEELNKVSYFKDDNYAANTCYTINDYEEIDWSYLEELSKIDLEYHEMHNSILVNISNSFFNTSNIQDLFKHTIDSFIDIRKEINIKYSEYYDLISEYKIDDILVAKSDEPNQDYCICDDNDSTMCDAA